MSRSHVIGTLLALSITGCATSPPSTPRGPGQGAHISETGTIRLSQESNAVSNDVDASAARVWGVLPGVYRKLRISAEVNEVDTRTIGTRGYTGSRIEAMRVHEVVRCGNQGSGPSSGGMYRTRLSITTRVVPAGDGASRILSEVNGLATPVEGTSTGTVACASTGVLEQRIRALTLEALGM